MTVDAEPQWLEVAEVLELHQRGIVRYGGLTGVRDIGLLESALGRPKMVFDYATECTYFDLAAAYAAGIVGNHPFVDGNKRTGASAIFLFLYRHALNFDPPSDDLASMIETLAAGRLDEKTLASRITAWTTPL